MLKDFRKIGRKGLIVGIAVLLTAVAVEVPITANYGKISCCRIDKELEESKDGNETVMAKIKIQPYIMSTVDKKNKVIKEIPLDMARKLSEKLNETFDKPVISARSKTKEILEILMRANVLPTYATYENLTISFKNLQNSSLFPKDTYIGTPFGATAPLGTSLDSYPLWTFAGVVLMLTPANVFWPVIPPQGGNITMGEEKKIPIPFLNISLDIHSYVQRGTSIVVYVCNALTLLLSWGIHPIMGDARIMAFFSVMTGLTGLGVTIEALPGETTWPVLDFFVGYTTLSIFIPLVQLWPNQ